MVAFLIFKRLGSKWLDSLFDRKLKVLEREQEELIRHAQSSIDREIHRAKQLYDREFPVLSDSWGLLNTAFELAEMSSTSLIYSVDCMDDETLQRFLLNIEMEPSRREEILRAPLHLRQTLFAHYSEMKRFRVIDESRQALQKYLAANSIYLESDLVAKFREILQMINNSNSEYLGRIHHYGFGSEISFKFEDNRKLASDGKAMLQELEKSMRTRLWSAAKAKDTPQD